MEQLRQKNAQKINLKRILGVVNTLLDSKKKKELERDKKREDKIIKGVKNIFKLKKK